MIARTAHARGFADLTAYLGRDKIQPDRSRAAWWAPFNLSAGDLRAAARAMERTAERNRMVQQPAYHLFVSVSPADDASHARMRLAAGRLLQALGLGEHQAVAVGHEDRGHPHVHLAINRVHPVTHRAWNATRDWPRIERALRRIEQEMGFRATPGRLAPTPDGQWADNARAMPVGAWRFEQRERDKAVRAVAAGLSPAPPRPSFLRSVRERFGPVLIGAGSWAELDEAAAAQGLTLVQTGRGLLVTDGDHFAGASRIARGCSLGDLTRDFGEDYAAFTARTREPGRNPLAAGPGGVTTAPADALSSAVPATAADRSRTEIPRQAGGAARDARDRAGSGDMGGGAREADPVSSAGGGGDVGEDRGAAAGEGGSGGGAPPPKRSRSRGADPGEHGGGGPGGRRDHHGAADAHGRDAEGGGRPHDGASGGGRGAGQTAGGEHPGGGEQHRGRAPRAGALRRRAQAARLPARGPARRLDGDRDPALRPPVLSVLGNDAGRRGGPEPGRASDRHVGAETPGRAAGPPAGARVGKHAGGGPGPAFHVERAPGGWAVVEAASGRRWTLLHETAATHLGSAANAATTGAALARVRRTLERETARRSHRERVARRAARELLEHAGGAVFADPARAADAVARHYEHFGAAGLRLHLRGAPQDFGALLVDSAPSDGPRHPERLPDARRQAWRAFGAAAESWLDVREGRRWTPPARFPDRPVGAVPRVDAGEAWLRDAPTRDLGPRSRGRDL
ncbi:relaxase/mobilization nuclease domain-containing protein [Longimicrobium terrae]|nr:relaxase/mobilization nuclease domain-containing protein [Longimicrobium terrae]